MTKWSEIISELYDPNPPLKELLLTHSQCVARKALRIAEENPALNADRQFLLEASMLHDIGICLCNAPAIHCFGEEPYIRHGILGGKILRQRGLERHARVCERHTGSGLTAGDIRRQNLPLPYIDLIPESIEERIICYADKFFSKSGNPTREKSIAEVEASLLRHGPEALARFRTLLPILS